jgi:hypothetical protein
MCDNNISESCSSALILKSFPRKIVLLKKDNEEWGKLVKCVSGI